VRLEGRAARRRDKGSRVETGQLVEVEAFQRPSEMRPVAEPGAPLEILAEDDSAGWIVINKPAGAPVHPLEPGETGTVLNALIAVRPHMFGVGEGGLRSGVVHRLDVDTSGVIVFATREECWQRLREAFREHRTTKIYRALVLGDLRGAGEASLHLVVAQHRPARVRVIDSDAAWSSAGARRCDLSWTVIERFRRGRHADRGQPGQRLPAPDPGDDGAPRASDRGRRGLRPGARGRPDRGRAPDAARAAAGGGRDRCKCG
jgi:23S rRNA pseudouridine1911/1915/1917 synthase